MPEASLVVRTEKKKPSCPNKKHSPLETRTYDKICPCALATSEFKGKVNGVIVYSQDECGITRVVGQFRSGFKKDKHYKFKITDDCGRVLRDMTHDLNVTFVDGGTDTFSAKLYDVNLNCDKHGVLNAHTLKPPADYNSTVPYKRHNKIDPCSSKYRKRDYGAETVIYENGNTYTAADITLI
ncbi:17982_t:CDS:1 [Gigaspora margarita]|uniref:17982_t:CDS:1 n=1 Tax=Gigaspora margarita TaxID=4874 RepID=A0ABN7V647_GIGMA|nr:17982_t:CDS:1 [Gigaspora margarita]